MVMADAGAGLGSGERRGIPQKKVAFFRDLGVSPEGHIGGREVDFHLYYIQGV